MQTKVKIFATAMEHIEDTQYTSKGKTSTVLVEKHLDYEIKSWKDKQFTIVNDMGEDMQVSDDILSLKIKKVKAILVGQDENAFAIIDRVQRAMNKAGLPKWYLDYYVKLSMRGDYNQLLCTAMDFCEDVGELRPSDEEIGAGQFVNED